MLFRYFLSYLALFLSFTGIAQTLTISSAANSGTYSYNAGTLTVSGSSNIQASQIQTWLALGDLTIVGSTSALTVNVNQAITSTTVGSDLTIGAATNTGAITISSDITIAGGFVVRGGDVQINSNITSTATGDLFFQGLSDSWSVRLATGKTIEKTSGTGLLTLQGNGRINNHVNVGSILASGSAQLDVVMIAEMDAGTAGTYNISTGNITTNGGNIWMGAGPKTGVWNGFSVGSTGVPGNTTANGIEITGNISTNGGDILLWSFLGSTSRSNGYGDIVAEGANRTINAGSGDIVLMTRYNDFVDDATILTVNTTGALILTPASSANFDVAVNFSGTMSSGTFTGSVGLAGLNISNFASLDELMVGSYNGTGISGDTPFIFTNTADFNLNAAISLAAKVSFYGGDIAVNQNLTSTLSGADILLQATGTISLAANKVIQTANGDITFKATANGVGTTTSSAIYLYAGSDLLSNGGNITLGGGYTGTQGNLYAATAISGGGYALRLNSGVSIDASGGNILLYGRNVSSYGDGVYLDGVNISTTGSGTIGIYGDSYGGYTSGSPTYFGGITFDNSAATIQTNGGNITLEGILTNSQSTQGYAINFYRNSGSPGQTQHIQILSQTGNIQVTADRGTSIGNGIGHSSWGHIYFGSPADNSFTASGNIKLSYSGFVGAVNNGFKVKTTGGVTYEPVGASFDDPQTFPLNSNHVLADGASSLTIGKAGNTSGITIGSNQSVGGDINIYAGTITLSGNLTATNGGDISLYSNNALAGLTSARTVNAAGTFTYAPQGTSFATAVTYPITNLTVTCNGLTIGKVGNLSNVSVGSATSIAGPVNIYGGALALNANLNTTNTSTGNISLNGTTLTGSSTITLPTGRTLTFNLSSNTTYAGVISGTGLNIVKEGTGVLALTGSNTPDFATLTISAGTYRLNSNQQLTLSGALTNNGTFVMRDGATFKQATSGSSVAGSGTFTVQKYLAGNSSTWNSTNSGRFWYMGIPVNSAPRSSFGNYDINTNRLFSYNETTKTYTNITDNAAALSSGTGYVHRRSTNDTLTFTGVGANGLYGGDMILTGLTRTSGSSVGFNLISNPYMAYLDWDAITKTNIEPTYYLRSHNSTANDITALITYNASTGLESNNSSISNSVDFSYLAPLQAIWVRVGTAASTGSLAMTRNMLSHQASNPGLKSSTIFPTLARVNLVDGARYDQMLVFMNQDMTNGADQYDSEKMFVSGVPQLYTMAAGKKLVMNGLNSNKKKISVPLFLELPESKVYNLQLADYNLEDGLILLEDKQEGTIQDFTINDTYAFYANNGVLQNRFVLHFFMSDNGITAQGPNNTWVEGDAPSYTEGGSVQISADAKGKVQISLDQPETEKVEGTVQATDANGRVVYLGALDGLTTEFQLNVPSGIYYLTVQSGSIIENKKVFIQD